MLVDVDAVLQQFYPGELGGLAIAEIVFGAANPSGMSQLVHIYLVSLTIMSSRQTPGFLPQKRSDHTCLLQLPQGRTSDRSRDDLSKWYPIVRTPGTPIISRIFFKRKVLSDIPYLHAVRPRYARPYMELRTWAELHHVQLVRPSEHSIHIPSDGHSAPIFSSQAPLFRRAKTSMSRSPFPTRVLWMGRKSFRCVCALSLFATGHLTGGMAIGIHDGHV